MLHMTKSPMCGSSSCIWGREGLAGGRVGGGRGGGEGGGGADGGGDGGNEGGSDGGREALQVSAVTADSGLGCDKEADYRC